MARAFLGLGSNMGDSLLFLRNAVADIPDVVGISPVYRTEPMGGPEDQDPYFNIVVALNTQLSPYELLALCQKLESDAQRVRTIRWGPRTLDVDVLWVEGIVMNEPDLEIPHPRMWERNFVMAPLFDVAPDVAGEDWAKRAVGAIEKLGPLNEL